MRLIIYLFCNLFVIDMIERRPLKQDFSLTKSDELELQDPDCNQECKSTCTHDVEECEQECGCDKKKRNKELEMRDPCDQNCLDNCEGDENECNHNCGCEMRKRTHELEIRDPCDQNCMDNCDGSDDECYRGCDCDEYVNWKKLMNWRFWKVWKVKCVNIFLTLRKNWRCFFSINVGDTIGGKKPKCI